jgi:putative transposase
MWVCVESGGTAAKWNGKPSKKGTGFEQLPEPHQHWHIDVSYLNVCATFYYLCSILDGYSRFLVHWDLREQMTEADIEIVMERAKSGIPGLSLGSSPTTALNLSPRTSRSSFGSRA